MVDVGVAQHDRVEGLRVEWKVAIALDGFVAFALEQAALEEQPLPVDFEQKHRAGRRAGRAEEMDFHALRMPGEGQSSRVKAAHPIHPMIDPFAACGGFRLD